MHTGGRRPGRPDRLGGSYPLRVGVTIGMHKLTAGAGYDYLTRQVAALDSTEKGHTGWRLTTPSAVKRPGGGSVLAWMASTA
jgi:hypothetical protein